MVEYCENIMFEERCELIIEEILHPTFSFLSTSTTGSKLHKVYTVSVRRQASYRTQINRHVTVRTEYHCNILEKDINKD